MPTPRSAAIAVRVKRGERTSSGMRKGPPERRSTTQKLAIATPKATAIASPPGRGIGRGCTRRPPGTSSIPKRRAKVPTSGVAIAASANARIVEPTKRIVVEDTAGTITLLRQVPFQVLASKTRGDALARQALGGSLV